MAAIDPDAPPEFDAETEGKPPRATLKIVRPPPGMDLEDDSDDDDYEDGDEDEDMEDSEDESNGGPSDPAKLKQARQAAALKDSDDDGSNGEDVDLKAAISKLIKGKDRATGDDDSDSDVSEGLEMEEVVVCTLDPTKVCSESSKMEIFFPIDELTIQLFHRLANNPLTSSLESTNASFSRSLVPTLFTLLVTMSCPLMITKIWTIVVMKRTNMATTILVLMKTNWI